MCRVEIDGCSSTPDCGTGASCTDVAAPGTGYTCACDAGYIGDSTTDTAASCAVPGMACSAESTLTCTWPAVKDDAGYCAGAACAAGDFGAATTACCKCESLPSADPSSAVPRAV